jgi:predicted SAM-dependent methyltransferase
MTSERQMKKLNVGCGDRKIHSFINVDIREDVHPDVVCDISKISETFENVDLIYACHVLEHFPDKPFLNQRTTWRDVLVDWHKSLRKNGILRISVPDLKVVCERYLKTKDLLEIKSFLYGGQKYDYDYHFYGWDFILLKSKLEEIGFTNVRIYDWRETEHSYVDDYSQAYLPHLRKSDGQLMSLNVEATKL